MVEQLIEVDVVSRQDLTPELFLLHLSAANGILSDWQPGAHIDVEVGDGTLRQFSLAGSLDDANSWVLGIRCETDGRGGSLWLRENALAGTRLKVSQPRNHFEYIASTSPVIFIAGGIGITPIFPMIAEAASAGREWQLHYVASSKESMILLDDISAFEANSNVKLYPRDTTERPDVREIILAAKGEVAVYCCGPEALMQNVEECAAELANVDAHVERFSPKPQDENSGLDTFEVNFSYSGMRATISKDQSILEVAKSMGIEVISSCKEGTCGSCETPIISGTPVHRDSVLSDKERSEGKCMMICISRSSSEVLELDL
jgi:ferredoxin-NADP reductase